MSEELSLLEQALAFAEKRQITLPVFSDVALKVQKASREERYDISEIERAIESDPALVAEVLRAANSAFFGGLSEVSSIRAAVLRLGLQRWPTSCSWLPRRAATPAIRKSPA
jgi:HD-like signal output (HDOD) protein